MGRPVRKFTCCDCLITLVQPHAKGALPKRCPGCRALLKVKRATKRPAPRRGEAPSTGLLNQHVLAQAATQRIALEQARHLLTMGVLGMEIGRYTIKEAAAAALAVLDQVDLRPIEMERPHAVCIP